MRITLSSAHMQRERTTLILINDCTTEFKRLYNESNKQVLEQLSAHREFGQYGKKM